ncbi:MAG TPA: permease prefix domain 1-containing protein [Steroidobacteraceae bacterium]|nr:permease prefix domain 1-containing protein [Steroidobacteraceae bacterium]
MTPAAGSASLEQQIAHWRQYLGNRPAMQAPDVAELEDHLRDQVKLLAAAGLDEDEAFFIAVRRMGNLDALSREFAREHPERLWKQLTAPAGDGDAAAPAARAELGIVIALAILAALAIKIPALFGLQMNGPGGAFYARNAGLFVLPLLAAYLAWKRRAGVAAWTWLGTAFAAAAFCANLHSFGPHSDLQPLTALHLPIALWFAVGVAYVGGGWFAAAGRRMDFVRFSGELFIYYVLIALGGGLLTALTLMMFRAIGVDAEWFAQGWLVPCGAMSAVIVGSWLVEAKQSVIENMAPVLTRLFTPLLVLVLLAFLATMAWTGHPVDVQREVLIAFDVLLALVAGLVLYAASARDPLAAPGFFDGMQLLLVACALLVDALALAAIARRISAFGFSANRVAALAENLILLVNLAGVAWYYTAFLRRRGAFAMLEQWQVAYLPVYPAWAAFVVVAFPLIFGL